MSIDALLDHVRFETEKLIDTSAEVSAKDIGMDPRCHKFYIGDDWIAVRKDMRRTVDYYGGLEYVESDFVTELGDYVFYRPEGWGDCRISEILERYHGE